MASDVTGAPEVAPKRVRAGVEVGLSVTGGLGRVRHVPPFVPEDPKEAQRLSALAEKVREDGKKARERRRVERAELYANLTTDYLASCGMRDLAAAASCFCGCHPDPGSRDIHDDGVCRCQKSKQEREKQRNDVLDSLLELTREQDDKLRSIRAQVQQEAKRLGVVLEQEGGAAPYQILGEVDGVRFYLRERHGEWRLQIPDSYAGADGDPVGGRSGVYVIAEGDERDLYSATDPAKPLKTAVALVRMHLKAEACPHTDARSFCPDCGTKVA